MKVERARLSARKYSPMHFLDDSREVNAYCAKCTNQRRLMLQIPAHCLTECPEGCDASEEFAVLRRVVWPTSENLNSNLKLIRISLRIGVL